MRKFAPIPLSIWQDQFLKKNRSLTLFYIYLRSSPQSNMLYLYNFSIVLACDDLKISLDEFNNNIDILEEEGYLQFDADNQMIWIRHAMILDMPMLKKTDNKVYGIQKLVNALDYCKCKSFLIDNFKEEFTTIYHLKYKKPKAKKQAPCKPLVSPL